VKLADYVVQFFVARGIHSVFGMSGGAAVHLFDAIGRAKGIQYICVQHEQAAAIAADGYARETGSVGVAVTTSGPGATNLLTGMCCSFYDSIPTVMLTGQVASFRIKKDPALRQKGFQETDIVAMAKSVTKYAVQLDAPDRIRFELERAWWTAQEGRPGPVLVDIPDDFQRAEVDPDDLEGFSAPVETTMQIDAEAQARMMEFMESAERPICILGSGLNHGISREELISWLEEWGFPFALTWGGKALIPARHKQHTGLVGICGSRSANYSVQNADLILVLGSRLSQNVTGGKTEWFGREAKIIVVDIDQSELDKFAPMGISVLGIHGRAGDFIRLAHPVGSELPRPRYAQWIKQVQKWKAMYKVAGETVTPEANTVDAIQFSRAISKAAQTGERCVVDTGGTLTWFCQGFEVKDRQRIISAWNFTPMGYALPASVGVAIAAPGERVVCVIGDGGLLLCLPEMATAARHQLPIKLFLYNNHCHGIQKHTLETWLDGRFEGVDEKSGLFFPDFLLAAKSFGWNTLTVDSAERMEGQIRVALETEGPVLVNVEISPNQQMSPMLKFGRPLEDQHPLLPRDEFEANMMIPQVSFSQD
jgi:acetolactate synthase-1/2/3 large subunit